MTDLRATYQLLPDLQTAISESLDRLQGNHVVRRIWEQDHTLWKPRPDEISNRLDWLNIAREMRAELPKLVAFREELIEAGFTDVVLLGMGGSSLAPDMFYDVFDSTELRLNVLDSTAPEAVLRVATDVDLSTTLFIVSSKSGTTVETLSFLNYFYDLAVRAVGPDEVGQHFVAITDPDSSLARRAEEQNFRRVYLNNPNIGGRYSALSFFGLIPAVLIGVNVALLLDRAEAMAAACGPEVPAFENPAVYLGTVLGVAAREGHDKLTFVMTPEIESFGYWLEQLIAESTGKEETGILPVDGEAVGLPSMYGEDRLFVYLRIGEEENYDAAIAKLVETGYPVIQIKLADAYDLGAEMWRWQMATAVAGHILGINPFDQPNVESAKQQAKQLVQAYAESGGLPSEQPVITDEAISVYGDLSADSVVDALENFLAEAAAGKDYIALQAYLPPTDETNLELLALQTALRNRFQVATTVGFGPRFLHSTGQLHKGDRGNGLFIVLTHDPARDVEIPQVGDSGPGGLSFGVLIRAQALGDIRALREANRRVIRFHLDGEILEGLRRLREAVDAP